MQEGFTTKQKFSKRVNLLAYKNELETVGSKSFRVRLRPRGLKLILFGTNSGTIFSCITAIRCTITIHLHFLKSKKIFEYF